MRPIEFRIPGVPPSENDWRRSKRSHWRLRAVRHKAWHGYVGLFSPRPGAPGWPSGKPISPAIVTISFRLPYGGDADNRCKSVLDGIVKAGLIVDDRAPHLYELRLRARRGSPAETHVKIEEAKDGDSGAAS